ERSSTTIFIRLALFEMLSTTTKTNGSWIGAPHRTGVTRAAHRTGVTRSAGSGNWPLTRHQQPPPEQARGLLDLRAPHDPVRRRDRCKLLGVPHRVAGAADQAAGLGIYRLEQSEGAGEATRHGVDGRVDDNLHVVLPSDGEMRLEHGDRVKVSWR